MASIRKVGKKYRAEICIKGVRESAYFDRKAAAQSWANVRTEEIRASNSGQSKVLTVGHALQRYHDSVSILKKGQRWEQVRIRRFLLDPLSKVKLYDLNPSHIAEWRDKRLQKVATSTVNREFNLLSHCFNLAVKEWRWLKVSPLPMVSRPKNPNHRDRLISESEIRDICFILSYEEDEPVVTKCQELAVAFLFALETAMRLGEILSLKKANISNRVALLADTKNGTSRRVPLSTRAVELLNKISPDKNGYFFKQNTEQASSLFRKYRKKININDMVFHDTRHEAITRLAKKLTVLDLARMTGHKNLNELQTYYNESAENIALLLD